MNGKTLIGVGLIALAWWWLHPVTSVSASYQVTEEGFDGGEVVVDFPS